MQNNFKVSLVRIVLAIGLFQVAAYWFSGSMACDEGVLAVPQPDTPLYYQAARRIVEGHPFSFSEGAAVCSGTTTVLYPFLLAIPYALGATGDSMFWAGFIVNALCYFVFLFGWCIAIRNWCQNETSAFLASILVALSGHCAYVTFAQSDIGFLLAYTALLAAALSADRRWAIGVLLILGPWVRPEGMICVVAYCMITGVYLVAQRYLPDLREKVSVNDFVICIIAVASCLGVFVLNYALTGHAQFSSVAGKGYFVQQSFAMAVYSTISDFVAMIKEMFMGLAKGVPRDYISIPGIGAILLSLGVTIYKWQERMVRGFLVLILAAFGGVLSVAQSGWQNTNCDRYVAWTFPIAIVFVAEAVIYIERKWMPSTLRKLPSVFVVLTALIGAVGLNFIFHSICRYVDPSRHFSHDCERIMEPGKSFGCDSECGLAYYFSPRHCFHIGGIYSPEFSPKDFTDNVERLRHNSELRFDYWILTSGIINFFGKDGVEKMGEVLLSGPEGRALARADWTLFDVPDASKFNGLALVDSIDVGYSFEEIEANYKVITRWGYEVFNPFVQCGMLEDKFIVDVGRVILGGDEMVVSLKPGIDTTVVMRTWPSHVINRTVGYPSKPIECAFSNPLKMNVAVDGNIVCTAAIAYATNSFTDVSFEIPGAAITSKKSKVGFLGDHITFGYWFYQ